MAVPEILKELMPQGSMGGWQRMLRPQPMHPAGASELGEVARLVGTQVENPPSPFIIGPQAPETCWSPIPWLPQLAADGTHCRGSPSWVPLIRPSRAPEGGSRAHVTVQPPLPLDPTEVATLPVPRLRSLRPARPETWTAGCPSPLEASRRRRWLGCLRERAPPCPLGPSRKTRAHSVPADRPAPRDIVMSSVCPRAIHLASQARGQEMWPKNTALLVFLPRHGGRGLFFWRRLKHDMKQSRLWALRSGAEGPRLSRGR